LQIIAIYIEDIPETFSINTKMIFYTNNQEYINRQQYRDLCLLSTRTDPFALSNNPKKYKSYTQEYWENKIKQSKSKKIFIALNNNEIIGTITGRKQENN
jgi:predicted PolB exonuclease-like 3'-5' exonuclease